MQCRVGTGMPSVLGNGNCGTATSGGLGLWDSRSEEGKNGED